MKQKPYQRIRILVSLLRVPTYLLLLVYLVLGCAIGMYSKGQAELPAIVYAQLFLAAMMIGFWYVNGTALNDYEDYEIDLINLKGDRDRPIVTGQASRHDVLISALFSGAASLGLALLLSIQHFAIMVGLLFLNISYSLKPFRISRRGGFAPLLLPLGYIFLPFMTGYLLVNNSVRNILWLLIAGYYLHFIGRIILKDYRDVKGDAAHGKRTFLLRHGNVAVCVIAALSITAGAGVTIYAMSSFIGPFQYTIIALLTFGLTILWKLSQTNAWNMQKPLLSAYGRAMTGITAATLLAFIAELNNFEYISSLALAVVLTIIYIWSANRALLYNTHRKDMAAGE